MTVKYARKLFTANKSQCHDVQVEEEDWDSGEREKKRTFSLHAIVSRITNNVRLGCRAMPMNGPIQNLRNKFCAHTEIKWENVMWQNMWRRSLKTAKPMCWRWTIANVLAIAVVIRCFMRWVQYFFFFSYSLRSILCCLTLDDDDTEIYNKEWRWLWCVEKSVSVRAWWAYLLSALQNAIEQLQYKRANLVLCCSGRDDVLLFGFFFVANNE